MYGRYGTENLSVILIAVAQRCVPQGVQLKFEPETFLAAGRRASHFFTPLLAARTQATPFC